METRKRALGRGLEQLFNSENLDLDSMEKQIYESASKEEIIEIDIEELRPNPYQPRKVFKDEALDELAESIKEHGVFQPIIVKKSIKGYEIIAGERRYRASKKAGLSKIPAIVRSFTDEQMMEIALLENLQRENLSAIEEAQAYKSMIEKLYLTQEELAKKVGKSRSAIANSIRLLSLPEKIKGYVLEEKLSVGHVRAILSIENDEIRIITAEKIIEKGMNVRQTEDYIASLLKEPKTKKKSPLEEEMKRYFATLEKKLSNQLKTKVCIHRGRKKGKIEIEYYNNEDFERLMKIFNK